MKKSAFSILSILVLSVFAFMSCSKGQEGKWEVVKYEVSSPGAQAITLTNIGSITFNSDGTGTKDINFPASYAATTIDDSPFNWTLKDDNYLVIDGYGSDFAKTWIVTRSGNNSQSWKATDGGALVQTLELKR